MCFSRLDQNHKGQVLRESRTHLEFLTPLLQPLVLQLRIGGQVFQSDPLQQTPRPPARCPPCSAPPLASENNWFDQAKVEVRQSAVLFHLYQGLHRSRYAVGRVRTKEEKKGVGNLLNVHPNLQNPDTLLRFELPTNPRAQGFHRCQIRLAEQPLENIQACVMSQRNDPLRRCLRRTLANVR